MRGVEIEYKAANGGSSHLLPRYVRLSLAKRRRIVIGQAISELATSNSLFTKQVKGGHVRNLAPILATFHSHESAIRKIHEFQDLGLVLVCDHRSCHHS
jgi:hypothetical protein